MPESLLAAIDDLNARVKAVRDQIEHPASPLSVRAIESGEELTVQTHKVVPVGEDPMPVQFESAGALRDAIHTYADAIVDLLESAHRART